MDKHCGICHNTSCSNHGKNISFLGDGWKCDYIPVPTNADRIRAMSDEELALFVRAIINAESCFCIDCDCDECFFKEPCSNSLKWYGKEIEWLQQPAEG